MKTNTRQGFSTFIPKFTHIIAISNAVCIFEYVLILTECRKQQYKATWSAIIYSFRMHNPSKALILISTFLVLFHVTLAGSWIPRQVEVLFWKT